MFNVHSLDLKKVAKGFGLQRPPHVDLSRYWLILDVKLGGAKIKKFNQMARHPK